MTFKDSEVEIVKRNKKQSKVFMKLPFGKMIKAEEE